VRTKSNDFSVYVLIKHLFHDDVDHFACGTFQHPHGYRLWVWHSGSVAISGETCTSEFVFLRALTSRQFRQPKRSQSLLARRFQAGYALLISISGAGPGGVARPSNCRSPAAAGAPSFAPFPKGGYDDGIHFW